MINPHPLLTTKGTPRNHINASYTGIGLPVCSYLLNTPCWPRSAALLTIPLNLFPPEITLLSSVLPEQDFK